MTFLVLTSHDQVSLSCMSEVLRIIERRAYPSENCTIRPFLAQVIQLRPGKNLSDLFRTRITRGTSAEGGFATLQTRRSPSAVWVANMSDFCLVEDACHVRVAIGDGPREVDKVCRIVNDGVKPARRTDPLLYLPRSVLVVLYCVFAYPMAYVLQSDNGAKAVIGSKMVLAETCSLVAGSNNMTSPLMLPGDY